jgi:hypothetical protein
VNPWDFLADFVVLFLAGFFSAIDQLLDAK